MESELIDRRTGETSGRNACEYLGARVVIRTPVPIIYYLYSQPQQCCLLPLV